MRALPAWARRVWRLAGRLAGEAGARLFLVGGGVRDALLGRDVKDLDLAIEGPAARLARELARALRARAIRHDRFGTATLSLAGGRRVDVARTRRESYPHPAALPRVEPAGILADLARRDFTIHALAVQYRPRRPPLWLDPHGGLDDLRRRRLRALHPQSFFDDPTRALRALRYSLRLGFGIERRTAAWMKVALHGGAFEALSGDRLRRELVLLFEECGVSRGLAALGRQGLLQLFDTSLEARIAEIVRAAAAAERAAAVAGLYGGSEAWKLALACLGSFSSAARRRQWVARLHPDASAAALWLRGPTRARRLAARLDRARARLPSRVVALCRTYTPGEQVLAFALAPPGPARRSLRCYWTHWMRIRPDVRGEDLLRAGVPQGRAIAVGLAAALRAKLDGRARTKRAQLAAALAAARRRP